MTKAALKTSSVRLTLSQEFGPRNITVNAVSPGATRTEANAASSDPGAGRLHHSPRRHSASSVGAGGMGVLVAFLASEDARWNSLGQVLDATGGLFLSDPGSLEDLGFPPVGTAWPLVAWRSRSGPGVRILRKSSRQTRL